MLGLTKVKCLVINPKPRGVQEFFVGHRSECFLGRLDLKMRQRHSLIVISPFHPAAPLLSV